MEEQWWHLFETDFDELSNELQRYLYDSFYRFAYKEIIFLLKDHFLAEDIIQESFLKATKRRRQLKDLNRGRAWVKRIVRNQMIDLIKGKKYRHWVSYEDYDNINNSAFQEIASEVDVETTFEKSLRNQMLQEAIMELKPDYRVVLLKYYMDENSQKKIAVELGTSEQAIAQRLVRARKALLSKFTKRWVDDNE